MKNLSFPGLPRVLIVDDEPRVRDGLSAQLRQEGMYVESVGDLAEAQRRIDARGFDVVFLDGSLPGSDHAAAIQQLRASDPAPDVLVLRGYGVDAGAVESMQQGASDVIEKPFTGDRVLATVRRVLEMRQLKTELYWVHDRVRQLTSTELVGLSPSIREVQARVDQFAQAPDTTVLVTGPRGAGKELVARSVHERSARREGPFVTVNCAAWTEALLEAELFGHEPGAFAGASSNGKDGLFAAAAGGTLFLDEIGALAPNLQARLLRVLHERAYRRVGGVRDLPVDVRVIASSSRDLRQQVQAGGFREDLFYRLDVTSVDVPSLRERAEDVPLLSHCFLDQIGRFMGKPLSGFTEEAMETLTEHFWPGNVRELRNAIEHACIACPSGMIDEAHLPKFTGGLPDGRDEIDRGPLVLNGSDRSIRALEAQLVAKVLEDTEWNISRAAAILGINRTTLYNKIRLYDLGQRPQQASVVA
jgi:DNA-binding NtrC family response regulator